uniref:antirestriction protein ArdA n=1 Tax=Enterocloster clostridioformis TaxID=1531 RepID=UPI0025A67B0C|nr:antirestriction protein ArdA [Enterocloster clostridioformis]
MIVKISADRRRGERGYEGAEIKLPANHFALADVFQRAQVPEDGGYSLHKFADCPGFLRTALIVCQDRTLEEVNFLAQKVSEMDESQLDTYEGIVLMRRDSDVDHPMTMKELINAAYNLDCFDFYPGIINDQILGEACIEGDLLDGLDKLPDEAHELLDEQKVGTEMRRTNQGYFTPKGYIYRCSYDEKEAYDGVHLPEMGAVHKGTISLCIKSVNCDSKAEEGVWLELPADEQMLRQALKTLGKVSFDSCLIAGCESILPSLENTFAGDEDIEKVNLLAERLTAFPDRRTLMKYKVILELECYPGLDRMLDIAGNMDCYDYDPVIVSDVDYGEYVLRESGIDTSDPAFSYFDFKSYGKRQLEKSGFISTPYGAITRNDRPFEQEFTKPRQGLTMV